MKNAMILVVASCVVATAVACSSSSSNNSNTDAGSSGSSSGSTDEAGGDDTGATASGSSSGDTTTEAGSGVMCTNSAGCGAGQVCCGSISMTTNCQAGPCPSTAVGVIQLCASATECFTAGDSCGPLAVAPTLPIKVCNPPSADGGQGDGGPTGEGGTGDGGGAGDGGGDAAPVDAAAGG